jgi:hypothetical protein
MTTRDDIPDLQGENIAQTVRDIMAELGGHELIVTPSTAGSAFDSPSIISVPEKRRVEDLTDQIRSAAEYLKPARRRGTARLEDLASLIGWANRFKGDTSALFANPDMAAPSLTCVADYHARGATNVDNTDGDPTARHCAHRGIYAFPMSDEWKAWMKVSLGEPGGAPVALGKDEMGEFIEANAKDVMDPTPAILAGKPDEANEGWENRLIETARQIEGRYGQLAQLLALSRHFQVFETSDLKLVSNRDTGEGEIQFLNEHKNAEGAPIRLPNLIIIAIPVFRGGAPYRMPVRFRYRKQGSEVKFILSVYNPHKVFEAAFREALDRAEAETGLPLFLGSPEA